MSKTDPPHDETRDDEPKKAHPEWIGSYRILDVLGEGGMGIVYLAEQKTPVHRRVALKVVRLGMSSSEVIARFEAERQVLALMSHPSIAKIFDAGTADDGRPYFAMEHVPGVPLADYCDLHRLDLVQRIRLVEQVCRGIQHAHQKGVIHRDIKPSNVLVQMHEGQPVPKIIDFGIAKALDQRVTERTLFTEQGQILGTPAYMAPEQVEMSGLGVDARTDVYSLGVLLYELLVGVLPFDAAELRRAGYLEIRRKLREDDPPRPSTRFSTLGDESTDAAMHRGTDRSTLVRRLRGELDWIVMKALEKDPTRRYQSASEFAADLDRHLNDDPVMAGPPSASYRLRKLVRKHRGKVAAVGSVFLTTVAGFVVSTLLYFDADAARRVAVDAKAAADKSRDAERDERSKAEEALARVEASDYRNTIALADRYWLDDNVARARAMLERCPEELRGWEWHHMMRRCDGEANRLPALSGQVVAWDPAGRFVAVGGSDGSTRLFRVGDWQEERVLREGRTSVRSLAFSGDGRRIVASGADGVVRVWNVATGLCVVTAVEDRGPVVEVAIDRAGDRIAWATSRTRELEKGVTTELHRPLRVIVWDVERDEEVAELLYSGMNVALSPDGNSVATLTSDMLGLSMNLCVWNVAEERIEHQLRPVSHPSGALRFEPDGSALLYANGVDVELWDPVSAQRMWGLDGHVERIGLACASTDGSVVATADGRGVVRLWDTQLSEVKQLLRVGTGFSSMALSPDGAGLATVGSDTGVRVWDTTRPQGGFVFDGWARSLTFVPGEDRLAVAEGASSPHQPAMVSLWAPVVDQVEHRMQATEVAASGDEDPVVASSPNGRWVASGHGGGAVHLWDAHTGELVVSVPHPGRITGLSFDSASGRLAVASEGPVRSRGGGGVGIRQIIGPGAARILEVPSGDELLVLPGAVAVTDLAFSPDGQTIALAAVHRSRRDPNRPSFVVEIRDAQGGETLRTLSGHEQVIPALAFHPEGHWLATGSWDRTARLWDVETGEELHVLRGHRSYVWDLAFAPDGKRLVTASDVLKLWDPASADEVATFDPPGESVVLAVAFSPDGGLLAGILDGRVLVWDGRTSR